MRIAIVGGGIVGLTTALSLAAAGFRPTVYEAVSDIKPLGVGINLLPHAVRELAELGLLEDLRKLGIEIEKLTYRMEDGREVWSEARGLKAGYRWPQIAVHRGHFHLFLLQKVLETLGPGAVRTGCVLSRIARRQTGASLYFDSPEADNPAVEADVAIGADGIHSAVRRQFYPNEGRPIWNGVSLFRSTTQLPRAWFGNEMLWAGHSSQKFIAYPIAFDRDRDEIQLNWVCDLRMAEPGSSPREDWNRLADRTALVPHYRSWMWNGVDVVSIISSSNSVFEFPMVDRDPVSRWSFGRVTLAGDAAHPMYPIGSNGATQGIIDARVLAYHLSTIPDPALALKRYEEARLEPTRKIILGNRAQGPDIVLEIARQRAADPNVEIESVIPLAERTEIAAAYKRLAGFSPDALNSLQSYSVRCLPDASEKKLS
jgi:2-polyprenyl-6-methoxyphenol hydroxylase-like FAD-dependent oxidoreductase